MGDEWDEQQRGEEWGAPPVWAIQSVHSRE